jgi:asparagine synthase (glutamine-hydrolysing)
MCGIIGIASAAGVTDGRWLVIGRDAMEHRGPDDSGEWWSATRSVGLAHRRLSILDLSSAGHQPMLDAPGQTALVFNGEIYNFRELRLELEQRGNRFRSQSDSEVILVAYRQWGDDFVSRLRGMFALAVYDNGRNRLLLARDRAGEKPLYYTMRDGSFRFASELKALLADPAMPRLIDHHSFHYYLERGFVPGERSMLQGVQKLPPAHALSFDVNTGTTKMWRYWSVPSLDTKRESSEQELSEELEELLESAVRAQLVADVPIGILLSGGVDSSLVTAMAARSSSRVKTFTVRFSGFGKYDETPHARLIARHFGTDHLEIEAGELGVEMLPVLARQFDDPLIDSSMLPTHLVSQVLRSHCTVALGGDGGDELFGGYSHYDRLLSLERLAGWIPLGPRRIAGSLAGHLPVGTKGRNWLQALAVDLNNDVPVVASYFDSAIRSKLLVSRVPDAIRQLHRSSASSRGDLLQRATRLDFETYLPEDILVKVDRASMLSSLEVRAPFLDHDVIEFAFRRVPSKLKATINGRKLLLKTLAQRLLPAAFDLNRKQGFSIPFPLWLQSGVWRDFFREVLLDRSQTTFDHRCVEQLLDGQRKGRANAERLFGLVMFELWRKAYGVAFV